MEIVGKKVVPSIKKYFYKLSQAMFLKRDDNWHKAVVPVLRKVRRFILNLIVVKAAYILSKFAQYIHVV